MKAKSTTMITIAATVILLLGMAACSNQSGVTPDEARSIAKEAFIYGYPMVDAYRIIYAYNLMPDNPEYKAPFNQIKSIPRVYTPEDRAVQSPNSDTPYSMLTADLRAEPLVLGVPEIEKDRYYSIQFVDAYTFNFAYVGSRATGNDAAHFLLAGPDWAGEVPAGIEKVIRSETNLVLAIYRTQLFNPGDLDNVKKIQAGYTVEPLSAYLGTEAPPPAPKMDYAAPIEMKGAETPLKFFEVLNFVLEYCPTVPSETDLMKRFAKIDVGAGKMFDPDAFSPEVRQAIKDGIADGWGAYETLKHEKVDTGEVTSGEMFGTRKFLSNNYLYRMTAAIIGIFGNSEQEAMYPVYTVDANGEKFDGSKHRYTLRFAPGQLPPVHAFWSVTMYGLPASLLVANPINRYLINSPMLEGLKRDPDGGVTIYIQADSPGKDLESNWLPAPKGPFWVAMRLYWPKEEALNGTWKRPPIESVRAGG